MDNHLCTRPPVQEQALDWFSQIGGFFFTAAGSWVQFGTRSWDCGNSGFKDLDRALAPAIILARQKSGKCSPNKSLQHYKLFRTATIWWSFVQSSFTCLLDPENNHLFLRLILCFDQGCLAHLIKSLPSFHQLDRLAHVKYLACLPNLGWSHLNRQRLDHQLVCLSPCSSITKNMDDKHTLNFYCIPPV
jgi:hypothetical protein